MRDQVTFFLNGKQITIENPSPDLLLVDYLRSPEVGLTGAKKACGQGGCGSCSVILSKWDDVSKKPVHRAINSCLRPVCSLGGLAVTTIEGTGGPARPHSAHLSYGDSFARQPPSSDDGNPAQVDAKDQGRKAREEVQKKVEGQKAATTYEDESLDGLNPVAYHLAMYNGSQCGYCSSGFVMNMFALLVQNPKPSSQEIENLLDGNICRCTGYRSILTGMKRFAKDWTSECDKDRIVCVPEAAHESQIPLGRIAVSFPEGAKAGGQPVSANGETKFYSGRKQAWHAPESLGDVQKIFEDSKEKYVRLVLGNTSYGIYPEEFHAADVLVDLRLIPDLCGVQDHGDWIQVGSATTFVDLIQALSTHTTGRWGSLSYMARRTAGSIVRNAATLAGNTMLVLKHIRDGEPFPSDSLTALTAIDAKLDILTISTGETAPISVSDLIARVVAEPAEADDMLIIRYHLPFGKKGEVVLAQKTALREVNAHAIVNSTCRLDLDDSLTVQDVALVFGGIAPYPWRAKKTEEALRGQTLSLKTFPQWARILEQEAKSELGAWTQRRESLPSEGVPDEYRTNLAIAHLYKVIVNALPAGDVPENLRSAGITKWGSWGVSDGLQLWKSRSDRKPLSDPVIKLSGFYQTSGRLRYTQEMVVPSGTLNAAFVQSRRALHKFYFINPESGARISAQELNAYLIKNKPGFIRLITVDDIPQGGVKTQGIGGDQPLLAIERVEYVGQSIALAIAETERDAIALADYVSRNCLDYEKVDWAGERDASWNDPILTLEDAIDKQSIFPDTPKSASRMVHIWKMRRPQSLLDWTNAKRGDLDRETLKRDGDVGGIPCHVIETSQMTGGQSHFYMETQACVVELTSEDRLVVYPSSQSPAGIHSSVASALGLDHIDVEVSVPHVGGAFGGKMETARFVAVPAALAAHVLKRPIRLAMPREADSLMIGKRHPYFGQVQIAVDRGILRKEDEGRIRGYQSKLWGDGGAFYDCSFVVSDCMQLRSDNAYQIDNYETQIEVCRTNTAPNTAFRAFGFIQSNLIMENAIEDAANELEMEPDVLREKNLYDRGDVTPSGQPLPYCYLKEVWEYLKNPIVVMNDGKEEIKFVGLAEKKRLVNEFNGQNKWRKQGLCMLPLKYGAGYNLPSLEHASALVLIYAGDGTVVVHQGGVEMGQGLLTMIEQVASYVLNIPMDMIRAKRPMTNVVPDPVSTGASTGTSYNGEAVKQACQVLRSRLTEFCYEMQKENGEEWCKKKHIDFWNYPATGWNTENAEEKNGKVTTKLIWQYIVKLASSNRVNLSVQFKAKIRGGATPISSFIYKPAEEQRALPGLERAEGAIDPVSALCEFIDFTYSAACSVVELDVLTGEVKIISSDIVYDAGWSLNPAIDVGQVEGAFVQGIGYLLTENLVFQMNGDEEGRLNSTNTWRYKPPATSTIPLSMNVHLFPRDGVKIPENQNNLFSSKEVGEPPMVLANTVFFALKAAIRASRIERELLGPFRLDAPATVQEVRRACEVTIAHLT